MDGVVVFALVAVVVVGGAVAEVVMVVAAVPAVGMLVAVGLCVVLGGQLLMTIVTPAATTTRMTIRAARAGLPMETLPLTFTSRSERPRRLLIGVIIRVDYYGYYSGELRGILGYFMYSKRMPS